MGCITDPVEHDEEGNNLNGRKKEAWCYKWNGGSVAAQMERNGRWNEREKLEKKL